VAPFVAVLMVPLLGMVSFMVDYGYLTVVRTNLQKAADGAALAGVMDLIPADNGSQNFDKARHTAVRFANFNMGYEAKLNPNDGSVSYGFTVLQDDIVTGKYDPETVNGTGPVTLDSSSGVIHNTMRVTLRRDGSANSPVTMFFAQVIGIQNQDVTATATAALRRPSQVRAGTYVLPFALPQEYWDSIGPGHQLTIFSDDNQLGEGTNGKTVNVTDPETAQEIPGNWGTVNLGASANSTSDMVDQIKNGLSQNNIDALYSEGRISTNSELPLPFYSNANTGLSQGMKDGVYAIIGETRLIPIYDHITSDKLNIAGNNAEFNIVHWGVVRVTESKFRGNKKTFIDATKAYTYDGALLANEDLSDTSYTGFDDSIFASPVLIR
jgi:Flp pilus assembly protein TadG